MEQSEIKKLLKEVIPEKNLYLKESMAKHTSFKVGGPADFLIKIEDMEELRKVLKIAKENDIPIYVVGNGSNLLVKDGGIRGIVIKMAIKEIELDRDTQTEDIYVTVGSGVSLGYLAQRLLKEELTGFEFAAGIPGTIGGAIRMNAGAHGGEFKDIVVSTTYMDKEGNIYIIGNEDHKFEYRNSIFSRTQDIVLTTTLKFQKGNKAEIKAKMDEYATWRKEKQPLEYPSAGSTFKRGDGFITAALIDKCGLKGYQVGGAEVSTKHAGFVINKNNATAKDILELIEIVKTKVQEQCGKNIDMEVQVIGEE